MNTRKKIGQARKLRQTASLPEQQAWFALRKLRHCGFPVRRQHPIGPYLVDFAIARAKLVVEIDGGVHRMEENLLRDQKRDAYLAAEGWRVLRIPASDALHNDYLIRQVTEALGL